MSDAPVRIEYRHLTLTDEAVLRPAGAGVFVALEAPPPVRTLLRAIASDGSVRALEVTRVVEVADDDHPARGFHARLVDEAALAKIDEVGSEHLPSPSAPAEVASTEQPSGSEDGSDGGTMGLAMPAPVVVDDDDDDGDESSENGTETENDDHEATPADASASDAEPRRGRRRRKKPRK